MIEKRGTCPKTLKFDRGPTMKNLLFILYYIRGTRDVYPLYNISAKNRGSYSSTTVPLIARLISSLLVFNFFLNPLQQNSFSLCTLGFSLTAGSPRGFCVKKINLALIGRGTFVRQPDKNAASLDGFGDSKALKYLSGGGRREK